MLLRLMQRQLIHGHPLSGKEAIRRIALRFSSLWQRLYVYTKLHMDLVYAAVENTLAKSDLPVLDIGCGMGLLAHYLSETNRNLDYLGVDNDPRKIAAGRTAAAAAKLSQVRLKVGNDTDLVEFYGNVVLLDMLHYLSAEQQRSLLQCCAKRVAPTGVLIIRNGLRSPHWRFLLTVLEEGLLYLSRWMKNRARHFPSAEEMSEILTDANLTVDIRPLWGKTPFNSYLVIARHCEGAVSR